MHRTRITPSDLFLYLILLFGPIAHGLVQTWAITVSHISIITLLTCSLLAALYSGRIKVYRTVVDLHLALFFSIVLLSIFTSVYAHAGRILLYKMLSCLALFYFVINTQRRRKKLLRLCSILVIFSGIYAFTGIFWRHGSLLGFFAVQQQQPGWISLFFANHNHFAGYLELTTGLSLGLATVRSGSKRILFFSMGILSVVGIVLSQSRGGIIAVAAGFCFYFALFICTRRRKTETLQVLAVFLLTVFLILISCFDLTSVVERMQLLEQDQVMNQEDRTEMWKGTLSMIADRPVLGWGPGCFATAFPAYKLPTHFFIRHPHNDYLELTAETGLAGLVAALIVIYALFASCIKKLIVAQYVYFQPIGVGALAGCFSFLVHAAVDFNFRIQSNAILFVVTAAIAVLAADKSSGKEEDIVCMDIMCNSTEKWVATVLILLIALLSYAAAISPYLGYRFLQKALEFQKNEKYDAALVALKKGLLFDPGNAELMNSTGYILLAQSATVGNGMDHKKIQQSLEWYEKAIQNCSTEGQYFSSKAYVLNLLGQKKEAEKAYQDALQRYPVHAFAWYRLAELYLAQNRTDEALIYFQRFLELGKRRYLGMVLDRLSDAGMDFDVLKKAVPETAYFRQAFAAYLSEKGRTWPALQELEFAFTLEPTAKNALAHIRGLLRNKNTDQALEAIDSYLKKFPESIPLNEQKARILQQIGRDHEAIFVYRQLYETASAKRLIHDTHQTDRNPAEYSISIARLYAKEGEHEKAVAVLEQEIKNTPDDAQLYYSLGTYQRAMKQPKPALENMKKAVQLAPENPVYRYGLGQEYQRRKLYLDAIEEWKECLVLRPGFAQCSAAIERVEEELGLDEDLIRYEQESAPELNSQQEAVDYSLHIAQLYAEKSRYADALTVLRKRIKEYPDQGRLYYTLGIYLRAMKRGKDALAALKKAVFFEYERAEYRYQLGKEYRRNGFTQKAEEEWRICLEIRPDSKRCKAAISGIEVETESASASLPY